MTDAADTLLYVRSLDEPDQSRQRLARQATTGLMQRVANGASVPGEVWQSLAAREQYLLRVRAVAETRYNRPVLSHWSAAAIHGLPIIGPWPDEVHLTVGRVSGGRSHLKVRRHGLPLVSDDVVEIDGLLVTSVARTAVDLAASSTFRDAVVAIDRALWVDRRGRHPTLATLEDLLGVYARRMPFRGSAKARSAMEFGTTLSDSPFESGSRVSMRIIGCPRPLLQTPFEDYQGNIGEGDFDWPEYSLIGEADGRTKYLDPVLRAGRTLEEVLLDEKRRGDRLQGIGRRLSRWDWSIGLDPARLRAHLLAAGLPVGCSW